MWLAITRPRSRRGAVLSGPQRFFGTTWRGVGRTARSPVRGRLATARHQAPATTSTSMACSCLPTSTPGSTAAPQANAGTVWLLDDGGIDRSTDGGITSSQRESISSLSTVNFAGAAVAGQGPYWGSTPVTTTVSPPTTADSTGVRNSTAAGTTTHRCGADPYRAHSMLVFTPRWNQTVALYETQPGNLPDISSSNHRQLIPGASGWQGKPDLERQQRLRNSWLPPARP